MEGKIGLLWEVLRRIPKAQISRANIAVTWRCNHKCLMCGVWKHNSEQDADKELDGGEIYKIIRNNKLIWVSITGGEPFLNNNIKDILSVSMENSKLVSIVSNGSLPELIDKSIWYALKSSEGKGMLIFNLSLEGNENKHNSIVGVKNSYSQVIETIERLKLIDDKRLYLGVESLCSSITDGNREFVENLTREYEIGLTYTREQVAPYYHNENGTGENAIKSLGYKRSLKPIDVMYNLFAVGMRKDNRKICEAGKYSVFIDPYANVYPCLPLAPNNPIKNLRETNYIIGDISRESNEVYKNCKAPCYTPCEVYASMLFRPWRLL